MPVLVGDLLVKLALENAQYKQELEASRRQSETSTSFMAKGAQVVGQAWKAAAPIVLAGLTAIAGATTFTLKEAMAAQEAQTQLGAVIESTGGIAGVSAEEANEYAASLQEVTRFSDENIIATESMLLTFTKIGEDVFPQATETALDMATALGQDATQSAVMLGKALNSPVEGVTALQRVGVQLTEAQKQQVAGFMAVNDIASAQTVILKELQVEFGGSARAAGTTFAGSLDILKNRFSDVAEEVGGALLPVLEDLVQDAGPELISALESLTTIGLPLFVDLLEASAVVLEKGSVGLNNMFGGLLAVRDALQTQEQAAVENNLTWDEYIDTLGIAGPVAEGINFIIGGTNEAMLLERQRIADVSTELEKFSTKTGLAKEGQQELKNEIAGVGTEAELTAEKVDILGNAYADMGMSSDAAEMSQIGLELANINYKESVGELTAALADEARSAIEDKLAVLTLKDAYAAGTITIAEYTSMMTDGIVTEEELARAHDKATETLSSYSEAQDAAIPKIQEGNEALQTTSDILANLPTEDATDKLGGLGETVTTTVVPTVTDLGRELLNLDSSLETSTQTADEMDQALINNISDMDLLSGRIEQLPSFHHFEFNVTVTGDVIPDFGGGQGGGKGEGQGGTGSATYLMAAPGAGEVTITGPDGGAGMPVGKGGAMPLPDRGKRRPVGKGMRSYAEMLQAVIGSFGLSEKEAKAALAKLGIFPEGAGGIGESKPFGGLGEGMPGPGSGFPTSPVGESMPYWGQDFHGAGGAMGTVGTPASRWNEPPVINVYIGGKRIVEEIVVEVVERERFGRVTGMKKRVR